MLQSRRGGNIAARAAGFSLFVAAVLVLLQGTLAAQANGVHASDVHPSAAPPKTYHDGSIRDLSAIGRRDVGCTQGLRRGYSLQAQIEMGRHDAQEVQTSSRLITDAVVTQYLNRIGQNLVRNSDAHIPFTFTIIDTRDVNAFSLPGGFIFVDSGLILAADNEAELAAVISHEIAHVAACHAAQQMANEEATDFVSMPLIFRLVARHITRNAVYLPPTRSFESEADFLAVEYLYKTGYDPQALPAFFETARAIRKQKLGSSREAFGPDAQLTDRIKGTEREIDTLLPPASGYKVDTSEFQEIKLRLAEVKKQPLNAVGTPRQIRSAATPHLPISSLRD